MEQPYGPPPVRQGYNLALASLITGIVVLLIGCCVPGIGIILGIAPIVVGAMALKAMGRDESDVQADSSRTMAIIGIVLGSLVVLYGIGSLLWLLIALPRMLPQMLDTPGGRPPFLP